jgi:hypothetical protein
MIGKQFCDAVNRMGRKLGKHGFKPLKGIKAMQLTGTLLWLRESPSAFSMHAISWNTLIGSKSLIT